MKIRCVWEHNGGDTLPGAADLPGAAQPRARRARIPGALWGARGVKAPAGGFDGLRRERRPLPQTGRKGKTLSHDFRDLPAFCWANPIDFPLWGML